MEESTDVTLLTMILTWCNMWFLYIATLSTIWEASMRFGTFKFLPDAHPRSVSWFRRLHVDHGTIKYSWASHCRSYSCFFFFFFFLCGVIVSTRVRALLAALWRHSKRKRVIAVGSAAKERPALVKQEQWNILLILSGPVMIFRERERMGGFE